MYKLCFDIYTVAHGTIQKPDPVIQSCPAVKLTINDECALPDVKSRSRDRADRAGSTWSRHVRSPASRESERGR